MTRVAVVAVVTLFSAVAFAAKPADKPIVAVLYFDAPATGPGDLVVFRKGLAQMVITDLVMASQLRVVERDRLEEVLAELKLGSTGKLDPATAQKVGKLLGAKYQIMGSLLPKGKDLRIDAKIVRVETGETVKAARVMTTPEDIFEGEQELAGKIQTLVAEADSQSPPPEPPAKKTLKLKYETAVKYAQALDAKDKKDTKAAVAKLTEVVKEQPEFLLANLDLVNLTK